VPLSVTRSIANHPLGIVPFFGEGSLRRIEGVGWARSGAGDRPRRPGLECVLRAQGYAFNGCSRDRSLPSTSTPQRSTSPGRTWNGRPTPTLSSFTATGTRVPRARPVRPDLRHGGLSRCPTATDRAARGTRPADRARHGGHPPASDRSQEDSQRRPAQETRALVVRVAAGTVRRPRQRALSCDTKHRLGRHDASGTRPQVRRSLGRCPGVQQSVVRRARPPPR
jgi:hypothetical protein